MSRARSQCMTTPALTPRAELISTTGTRLFQERTTDRVSRVIGPMLSCDAWESSTFGGLRLGTAVGEDTRSLVLNVERGHALKYAEEKSYGEAYLAALDQDISRLLALWGLSVLLITYGEDVSRLRDEGVRRHGAQGTKAVIQRLRSASGSLHATPADIQTVAAEAIALTRGEERKWLGREVPEFTALPSVIPLPETTLLDSLASGIQGEAESLRTRERELRDLLMIDATTESTIANLGLQGLLLWFTAALILLTVAVLVVAIVTLAKSG